jgi:hypothetical protein
MQVSNSSFLGQVVPVSTHQGLTREASLTIAQHCESNLIFRSKRTIQVLVGSSNALKVAAAHKAVSAWAQAYLGKVEIRDTGCEVSSEIDEQPHGYDHTLQGAKNRLVNLRKKAISKTEDGVLTILIAMENGVMKEPIHNLRNPEIFKNDDNTAWVDRCIVIAEMKFNELKWYAQASSVGVTTPRDCVEGAANFKWTRTAGSFIAEKYQANAKDWHGTIAGKGREEIMNQATLSAFGLQQ